jgi:DNA polymerase-1
VEDVAQAEAMLDFIRQRAVAHVGFDTEFRYSRPGLCLGRKQIVHDCRSVCPLLLSLAFAEPDGQGGGGLYRFVVDLRAPGLRPMLEDLFRMPYCFVAHFAQAELFCLFQLGLPAPDMLWDTWACEKALSLGRHHKNYAVRPGADPAATARAEDDAREREVFRYSLVATCDRYGVHHPFAGDKERLQHSFLDHPDDAPFSREQLEYAAADAVAAASLYPHQVLAATQAGPLQHLVKVEMTWAATNARMIWNGVLVDTEKCRLAQDACDRHLEELGPRLREYGITNVRSSKQMERFFAQLGLLEHFRRGGKFSFDKDRLKEVEDRHPAIPLIRAARRVYDLLDEKILSEALVGADGRVHPDHSQLGAQTGRQTCRRPNVLGLGRVFRPLIVPGPGRGIGEADWCQIEVGVAGAVYHDRRLVEMFNSGDVYSAMAQHFYADRLSVEDRFMEGKEFKKKHPALRARMKLCTLGIIYGLTPRGLALYLDTTEADAAALQERFMGMFPDLRRGLDQAPAYGAVRGYATTVSGLRRHRALGQGVLSPWERNWMTNHPVQGSAAVVFKAAGNRLDKLYRPYDAWLIIPMHDAFVFEAPLDVLEKVAELTRRVMCEAVQEYFPELRPEVEVNIEHPECWNKDGHVDSIERWMEHPTFTL